MTQAQLDRAVARRTGESVRTVTRLGFSALPAGPADPHPEALYLVVDCPHCGRPALFPGRRTDGTCPPAVCPGCDVPFAFDLRDVYVTASPRGRRPPTRRKS
jgi:hypothetical protein